MLKMVILGTHKEYRYGSGADIDDSYNADSVRDSSSYDSNCLLIKIA